MAHQSPKHHQIPSAANLPAWVKKQPQHSATLSVANSLVQTLKPQAPLVQTLRPLALLMLLVQTQLMMERLMLTLQVQQRMLLLQVVPKWWRGSQQRPQVVARPAPDPQCLAVLLAPSIPQPRVGEPEFRADTRGFSGL